MPSEITFSKNFKVCPMTSKWPSHQTYRSNSGYWPPPHPLPSINNCVGLLCSMIIHFRDSFGVSPYCTGIHLNFRHKMLEASNYRHPRISCVPPQRRIFRKTIIGILVCKLWYTLWAALLINKLNISSVSGHDVSILIYKNSNNSNNPFLR